MQGCGSPGFCRGLGFAHAPPQVRGRRVCTWEAPGWEGGEDSPPSPPPLLSGVREPPLAAQGCRGWGQGMSWTGPPTISNTPLVPGLRVSGGREPPPDSWLHRVGVMKLEHS